MSAGWGKIRQAAAYAGVSTRTMRDWLKQGLKHSRVGGCILLRFSDVDAFIEKFTVRENAIDVVVDDVLKGFNS